MKEFMELIHLHFAGELTPQQHQALKAWLKEDPSHRDQFVREAMIHRQLVDAMASKKTLNESFVDLPLPGVPLVSEDEALLGDSWDPSADSSTSLFTWGGTLPKLGLLLCVLTLIVVTATWVAKPLQRDPSRDTALDTTNDIPTPETICKVRDSAVASVEPLSPCTWQSESGKQSTPNTKATSRVASGRTLRLLDGKARVSFDCGAVLTLSGPTVLRVDSDMDATLLDGNISAVVSQEAIGFLLHTTEMDVRDLGTAFDVHVDPKNGTKVEVVDGEVEADLAKRAGHDKETINLTQGQYIRTGSKQSVTPENLRVFHGTRVDFDSPDSLDLFAIQRPDSTLYQLDSEAGKLMLDATCGSIYARVVHRGDNLFLLPVSSSADLDVVLTVHHFEPRLVIEHIGLVYMADEDNYARIIYANGGQNYMKFTIEKEGVPFGEIEKPIQFGSQPFKLRLTRRGNEISSWWSTDNGKSWTFRDKGIAPLNAKYVGFYVANDLPEGTVGNRAWIERFEVECSE